MLDLTLLINRGLRCGIMKVELILQNGPFWNIKCSEITWTRLNLCSCSWCTDGQRVIMDSREIIMIFKTSAKIKEEFLNIISQPFCEKLSHGPPYRSRFSPKSFVFPRFSLPNPGRFPTRSSAIIKSCSKTHHLMFVCATLSLLSEKIRPRERCSSGDTSGIPGMLLGSRADFWDHPTCTTSCPSLLFRVAGHTFLLCRR